MGHLEMTPIRCGSKFQIIQVAIVSTRVTLSTCGYFLGLLSAIVERNSNLCTLCERLVRKEEELRVPSLCRLSKRSNLEALAIFAFSHNLRAFISGIVIVRAIERHGEVLNVFAFVSITVINQTQPTGRRILNFVNSTTAAPANFDTVQMNIRHVGDIKFSLTVSTNGNLLLNRSATIRIVPCRIWTIHKNTKTSIGCALEINLLRTSQIGIPQVIDVGITINYATLLKRNAQVVLTSEILYDALFALIGLRRNRLRICLKTIPRLEHSHVKVNELASGIHTYRTQYRKYQCKQHRVSFSHLF